MNHFCLFSEYSHQTKRFCQALLSLVFIGWKKFFLQINIIRFFSNTNALGDSESLPHEPFLLPMPHTLLVLNYKPRGKDTWQFNWLMEHSGEAHSHSPQNALLSTWLNKWMLWSLSCFRLDQWNCSQKNCQCLFIWFNQLVFPIILQSQAYKRIT